MNLCKDLLKGYDVGCEVAQRQFVQSVVLINKSDVLDYSINKPKLDINNNYNCAYSVNFRLKEGSKGKAISNLATGRSVSGTHESSLNDNVFEYTHNVNFVVNGYDERTACFLHNLIKGYYFAALLLTDGTVIIYGFDHGLRLNGMNVDLAGNAGITSIKLSTGKNEEESDMPYIYKSASSSEVLDYENLFADIPQFRSGDFNNDFNNDFFI